MVEYLFAFVLYAIFSFGLGYFPLWLVFLLAFLSLTCYTLKCGGVMKNGFFFPSLFCSICLVSILGNTAVPSVLAHHIWCLSR